MATAVVETDCQVKATLVIDDKLLGFEERSCGTPVKEPAPEPGAGDQKPGIPEIFAPAPSQEDNQVLLARLLDLAQSLKDNRCDSGAVSPSPLTVSTAGSTDPVPSTPTDYEASPHRSMSSSDLSPDVLAAAVQQLSLSQGSRAHSEPIPAPYTHAGWTAHTAPVPAPSPVMLQHFKTQQAAQAAAIATAQRAAAYQQAAAQATVAQMMGVAPALEPLNPAIFGLPPGVGMVQAPIAPVFDIGALPGYNQTFGYMPRPVRGPGRAHGAAFGRTAIPRMIVDYDECLVGPDGRYQSYCRQFISEEINEVALRVLHHVRTAQLTDIPAVSRLIGKRYFCSLKEVSKVVESARMLLIAPDVRPSHSAHIRPVRMLQDVMAAADAAGVPYIFCLSRKGIGQVFGREKAMSIVAVMHLDGIEAEAVALMEAAACGRQAYAEHHNVVGMPGMMPAQLPAQLTGGSMAPYLGGSDPGETVRRSLPPMTPFLSGGYPAVDPF